MVFLIPIFVIIVSVFVIDHIYFSKENEIAKANHQQKTKDGLKNEKQQYIENILNQHK
ncbi:hypothetical protein IY885_07370 [Campylobacter volucris]|uniref:hypothetical protein n=1 Tax=Campylobacter volucris TaxID=1031542 RepID=UPI0014046F54|nr:hypothetical protein [Campylobacter volucris]MBF7068081.1 hypothetical protein [Campylobacter volucris]